MLSKYTFLAPNLIRVSEEGEIKPTSLLGPPPLDFKTTLPNQPSLIPPVHSTHLVCTQHIKKEILYFLCCVAGCQNQSCKSAAVKKQINCLQSINGFLKSKMSPWLSKFFICSLGEAGGWLGVLRQIVNEKFEKTKSTFLCHEASSHAFLSLQQSKNKSTVYIF